MIEFRSFANVSKKQALSSSATYQASAAIRNIREERRSRRQQQATSHSKFISSWSILVSPFLPLKA
jgi:hypothetical protein